MTDRILTANPSDVELAPAPFPREWVIEGDPRAAARELTRSDDAAMKVVVWSCSPGRFRWQYSVDEMVQVLSGEVFVTNERGEERRLGPGDTAFFPAGTVSVWRITAELRKVAVCRVAPPKPVAFALRAGGGVARRVKALFNVNGRDDDDRDPLGSNPLRESPI